MAPDKQQSTSVTKETSDCFDDSRWFTLRAVANFTTVLRACIFTLAETNQTQVPSQNSLLWNNDPTTMIRAYHGTTMPQWGPNKFNLTLCPSILVVSQHWSPESQFDSLRLSASKFQTQSADYTWPYRVAAWPPEIRLGGSSTIPSCLLCT